MFKSLKTMLILITAFIVFILIVAYIGYRANNAPPPGCGTMDPFCVTPSNLNSFEQEGKNLFNINCASCHAKDRNLTGPALADIDSIRLYNWLSMREMDKLDSTLFKNWSIEYHKVNWGRSFTDEDKNRIYAFLISK